MSPTPPAVPQPPQPTPGAAPVERIRNTVVNAIAATVPVPYNPGAAFPLVARHLGLGAPLTRETDVDGYRAQGYALGIVYARIGEWDNVQVMDY